MVSVEWSYLEPFRLCRHPSIRTLWWSDFRSVQVGGPRFSRCCYLIIDLGSPLFDGSWARTWVQLESKYCQIGSVYDNADQS